MSAGACCPDACSSQLADRGLNLCPACRAVLLPEAQAGGAAHRTAEGHGRCGVGGRLPPQRLSDCGRCHPLLDQGTSSICLLHVITTQIPYHLQHSTPLSLSQAGAGSSTFCVPLQAYSSHLTDSCTLHQGRKFSLKGLLADGSKRVKGDASDTLAPEFEGGSMFIFRLAPQVRTMISLRPCVEVFMRICCACSRLTDSCCLLDSWACSSSIFLHLAGLSPLPPACVGHRPLHPARTRQTVHRQPHRCRQHLCQRLHSGADRPGILLSVPSI